MTTPTYYWAVGNFAGQAQCSAPAPSGGLYAPCWSQYTMALLSAAGAVTGVATAGPVATGTGRTATGRGYLAATVDPAGTLYATGGDNILYVYDGAGVNANTTLPSGKFYKGVAWANSKLYVASAVDGDVLVYASKAAAVAGTHTAGTSFAFPVTAMVVDGANLYAARSSNKDVAAYLLSTSAVTSLTGSPVATPVALATSAAVTGVVAAGHTLGGVASGIAAVAVSPASASTAAFTVPSTGAVAIATGLDPAWTVAASCTGVTGAGGLAWTPAGTEIIVTGTSDIYVLSLTGTTPAVSQTLAVASCTAVAVTSDGAAALVCGPTGVHTISAVAGTWSLDTPVSIGGSAAVGVVMISPTQAAVAAATGEVYVLTRSGTAWAVALSYSTPFSAITGMITDPVTGDAVVIGTISGQGAVAFISPFTGTVAGTLTWTGNAVSVVAVNNQIVVLDTTSNLLRFMPAIPTLLGAGATQTPEPTGTVVLGATPQCLWMSSTSAVDFGAMPTPYAYSRVTSGSVAIYTGGAWGSGYVLGIGHDPSAVAWNAAGTEVDVVTVQNDWYRFLVSGATLTLTSQSQVPEYTGQASGTPLGLSSLTWSGSHLYATTVFGGAIIQLV